MWTAAVRWPRAAAATTLVLACVAAFLLGARTPSAPGIEPQTVADYIHAVIEADRTIYTRHVVDRLQAKGVVAASEQWELQNTLPLPAQLLIDAARLVARQNRGIRYRLISLWPIYERNGPATDFERAGLQAMLENRRRPYTGFVENGDSRFFQAIYPDFAVGASCVSCHNAHPNSPRRDFQLNDVMGGVVITIPVGR